MVVTALLARCLRFFCVTVGWPGTQQQARHQRELGKLREDVRRAISTTHPGAASRQYWSSRERALRTWLVYNSWTRCPSCRLWHARGLHAADFDAGRPWQPQQCYQCSHRGGPESAPQAAAWPAAMQGLSLEIQTVLAVVDVLQGQPKKHPHGYRRKTQMTRIAWKATSVEDRLQGLPRHHRAAARRAHTWLLTENAPYAAWHAKHLQVLREDNSLDLFPSAIQEPYLESAAWPLWYCMSASCESRLWAGAWAEPFAPYGHSTGQTWQSAKELFLRKVFSEVPDFARSYALLQFQFDRYVFRKIRCRAHVADTVGCDAPWLLSTCHWTPAYWHRQHRALQDVTLQLGTPDLFVTISPYEWTFPFPYWIRKAHEALGAGPTDCPGIEVLAIAHALHEICAGALAGHTRGKWRRNYLRTPGEDGIPAYFARFEFQDGGVQQQYGRGRGSLHVHALFWLKDAPATALQAALCADLPTDEPELRVLAERLQKGAGVRVPQHEGASQWHWSTQAQQWHLRLKHTAAFAARKLRPFFKFILRVLQCHSDVQWWHSRGALLQYVAGYVSKYAESFEERWLADALHPLGAALAVCHQWKASEAEMVMTLARENMAFTNAVIVDYRPPTFRGPEDGALHLYRRRPAELQPWTFLAWLRRHLVTGSFEAHNLRASLRRRKFVAVAVDYYRFPQDTYFFQWLLLNVPHRAIEDLLPEPCWRVDAELRFCCAAVLKCPDQWADDGWLQDFFELQGHREEHVASCLALLRSRRWLIRGQLAGTLPRRAFCRSPAASAGLSPEQARFAASLRQDLETAGLEHWEGTTRRPRFLTGGPGTGKTFCLMSFAAEAAAQERNVLVATPTGKLASSARRLPRVRAMTVHRAFGLMTNSTDAAYVSQFDVWIILELGMLTQQAFERIYWAWIQCDRLPVLVCDGDFQQLPPPVADPKDARDSAFWRRFRVTTLMQQHRCKCPQLASFATLVRTTLPSQTEINAFFDGLVLGDELARDALEAGWAALPGAEVFCATGVSVRFVNEVGYALCPGDGAGRVWAWCGDEAVRMDLKHGCRVMITRNSSHDLDVCNGQVGVLDALSPAGLLLDVGWRLLCVHPRTAWDEARQRQVSAYDICLGYATTVHKAEGATVPAAILVFEDFAPPAWGYTAITRCATRQTLRAIGWPCRRHFHPRSP